MAETPPSFNLQDLGAGQVRGRLDAGDDTVIIPVGSCERHGNPFTPLGIDGMVTQAIVERAAAKAGVLYTPIVPFGYTPHHMGRPGEGLGTVTLRAETYRRVLEDVGRSLIYHGFNKLVFVSFHGFNVSNAEEVLFSLRFKTGAMAVFFGGRESPRVAEILGSSPQRLASDFEAAVAMAIMGERFDRGAYLSHGYRVHAPQWLGPDFIKRAGTGMAVSFGGSENIFVGMDDFEFVSPVAHNDALPSQATAEKGRQVLDAVSDDLAAFLRSVKPLAVKATSREFPDRSR